MNLSLIINKTKRYPTAIVCAVLLLVFVVLILLRGGIAPELMSQEADLRSREKTIQTNIKNSKNIEQETERLESMVEGIGPRLFTREERAVNINFFYGFEDETGVVISNITQLPQPDPIYAKGGARALKLHSTLVYDINLSAPFPNLLRFLHEIYRVDPFIRVADFQVSRGKDELEGVIVNARLRVLVLANKEKI